MSFLERLEWRHATKAFDPAKPVSDADFAKILTAIRMAPTSFGLQPFRVRIVTDAATKQKLFDAGWKQAQFSTASHILAFSNIADMSSRIDGLIALMAGGDAAKREKLAGYENIVKKFLATMTAEQVRFWADKQAYIALGFGMAAAAELAVDSCPMEGFSVPQVNAILGLPAGESVSAMLTLGHRDEKQPPRAKVRFADKDIFSK